MISLAAYGLDLVNAHCSPFFRGALVEASRARTSVYTWEVDLDYQPGTPLPTLKNNL